MTTRTNIILDDELVALAMQRAGVQTKKAAVEAALRAFVRKPDYTGLLALQGSGVIADDYDPDAVYAYPAAETARAGYAVAEPAARAYASRKTTGHKTAPRKTKK